MIEIMERERNLKNVKQIGTPREENKIYVENLAYSKLKEINYKEKRVFILMGHTERMEGRYATFVEAVIPVNTMEFAGNTPKWNNHMWSEVFKEIKRIYEDMIIVGWAIDIKGMTPKMTPDLERIHREHFGGVHQLLFLMNSLEAEETFYRYKENHLIPKEGFYIYYRTRSTFGTSSQNVSAVSKTETNSYVKDTQTTFEKGTVPIIDYEEQVRKKKLQNASVSLDMNVQEWTQNMQAKGGRYRQMLKEKNGKPSSSKGANAGLVVAAAVLVFIIGVGVYENKDALVEKANNQNVQPVAGEVLSTTEQQNTDNTKPLETQNNTTESPNSQMQQNQELEADITNNQTEVNTIPIEIISGEHTE